MARKIDIVFNSEKGKSSFQIASGYISVTTVLFEKEDIVAVIDAKGAVEFYNINDELLAAGEVSAVESGRQVYEEVCCEADENAIIIRFPIVKWIDNYPHCDGEHDRWDSKIIGYHTLKLDRLTNSVVCE